MSARRKPVFVARDGGLWLDDLPVFVGDDSALDSAILSLAAGTSPALIVTANVDQTVAYSTMTQVRGLLQKAAMITLDGMPLVWLARRLGVHAERQTGADALVRMTSRSAAEGFSVAIVGGSDEAGEAAVARLTQAHPGASVTHVRLPSLSSASDPASALAVDELAALTPSVIFLCLGFPKQEEWYVHWADRLPPGAYIGAGAAVDFAAGVRKRAPQWAQGIGAEWTWRLVQEPGRLWRRYLVDGWLFLPVLMRSLLRLGGQQR